MVVVAVAGGTGNLGQAIVAAINSAKKHEVFVLSRKVNPDFEARTGVKVLEVDYADVPGLTKVLEDNNIHTVVSALIMMPSPTGEAPKEIELVRAANASKVTKRMVTSDWGGDIKEEHISQLPSVGPKLEVRKLLQELTDLETTWVVNGIMLDYWTAPKIPSTMPPVTLVMDIPHKVAAIPGDGNVTNTFTHTRDIAKFTAAMLDLDKWDPVSYIVGDRVTWNEFLRLAEEATGSTFEVTYDTLESLEKGETTELPGQVAAYPFFPKAMLRHFATIFGLWWAKGELDLKPARTLNEAFPEIHALKVKEGLKLAWSD